MIRSRRGWMALFAVVGVLCVGQLAHAVDFAGDFVATEGNRQTAAGALYVKGNNLYRQELSHGPGKMTIIYNLDRKTAWFVDPAKKTYFSQQIPANQVASQRDMLRGKFFSHFSHQMKMKKAGTETVNGYSCEKTVAEGNGGKITTWYSKKLDFVLRTDVAMTMGKQTMSNRQEYRHIKERALPASLFVPPAGYKQVAPPKRQPMQGGRMGRRGGGGRMMQRRGGTESRRGR